MTDDRDFIGFTKLSTSKQIRPPQEVLDLLDAVPGITAIIFRKTDDGEVIISSKDLSESL